MIRGAWLAGALALALCAPVAAQHHNEHDARALKEDPRLAEGQIAPVLEGLGTHHHNAVALVIEHPVASSRIDGRIGPKKNSTGGSPDGVSFDQR